jgi:hypothetical protein
MDRIATESNGRDRLEWIGTEPNGDERRGQERL